MKEKAFNEYDMELAEWRGQVVKTLEDVEEQNKELKGMFQQHFKEQRALLDKYLPQFNRLQEEFNHICGELPDKGFCAKVDKLCDDMYPKNEESIPDKMKILWYDRKLLKFVLATSIGALITGLVTLGIGFMRGVF